MFFRIAVLLTFSSVLTLFCSCSKPAVQNEWINLTFMDVRNVTFKVSIKLTNAVFDNQSRYLKVDGIVKNRMDEYREFNLKNWTFRLDENGKYLKPHTAGLPVVPLAAVNPSSPAREEPFEILYRIDQPGNLTNITLDYADQFMLTGQINRIIASVQVHVANGTVSSRG